MVGIYSAVSGLQANQMALAVSASNTANLNTNGFKARSTVLSSSAPMGSPPREVGSGVQVASVATNFSSGALERTDNPLDLAIGGPGFFAVESESGQTHYTRSGSFFTDSNGFVRNGSGEYLLGTAGRIQIPTGSAGVSVGSDGVVSAQQSNGTSTNVGTVALASIPSPNGLQTEGNGLFSTTTASGLATLSAPTSGLIQSGSLEISNVDLAQEQVSSILAQRGFEANAATIRVTDEMLRTVYQLGRRRQET